MINFMFFINYYEIKSLYLVSLWSFYTSILFLYCKYWKDEIRLRHIYILKKKIIFYYYLIIKKTNNSVVYKI